MQVGFIGLGTMGGKMAANLQKAGYRLVVHDARRDAAASHLAAGAVWADTPRQVAEAAEVVFTSLPGPIEVETVTLGEGGLLAGIRPDSAYFDLSTNSPAVVRRLHAAFAERKAHMLDAFRKVERLADSPHHIIPGHDPLVMQQYPAPSPAFQDIVVRLDVNPAV